MYNINLRPLLRNTYATAVRATIGLNKRMIGAATHYNCCALLHLPIPLIGFPDRPVSAEEAISEIH